MTRTREALARGDHTLVRRRTNRLKSAAASAGAKGLVHIVGALENEPTVTAEAVETEWRRVSGGRSRSGGPRSRAVLPHLVNAKQRGALLKILRARFEEHANRHPGLAWADVEARLRASPAKLTVLEAMEKTGGEPDVIGPAATASDLPRPAPRLALSTRSTLPLSSRQGVLNLKR